MNTVTCMKLCILLQFVKKTSGCHDASEEGACRLQWLSIHRLHKLWHTLGIGRNELDTMYRTLNLARNTSVKYQVESFQKRHNEEVATIAVHPLEKEEMSTLCSLSYNRGVFCTNTYTDSKGLGKKITCYGVGSVVVRPGDTVLVPGTEQNSARPWLQAFLFRPREEDRSPKHYHLVGFALLIPFITSYWTVKPGGENWYLHSLSSRYP